MNTIIIYNSENINLRLFEKRFNSFLKVNLFLKVLKLGIISICKEFINIQFSTFRHIFVSFFKQKQRCNQEYYFVNKATNRKPYFRLRK